MNGIKKTIRGIIPESCINTYHRICANIAGISNSFPARKMFVIGVTGTKGKTSTSNYIWSVLNAGGYKAGLMTTANFRIGESEEINSLHMSMPSPFFIQKKLREMAQTGVTVAVIEMTSEGMRQHRHACIPVDIAVFTNLTPEHIASHGSFDAYKKAKGELFKAFSHRPRTIGGRTIERIIIANADSEHAGYYLSFPADKKVTFGQSAGDVHAENILQNSNGTTFSVANETYSLSIPGAFNVYNALPAMVIGRIFSVATEKIRHGLASLSVIPGRMEKINQGQPFTVIVDFAHEEASMRALLESVKTYKKSSSKIILLSGGAGGGRDRKPMTNVGARESDMLVLTIEDAYAEDRTSLLDTVVAVAKEAGKEVGKNLFPILDRREAIKKALSLAQADDIVLITGKGGEQVMVTNAGRVPWDERKIVTEATKQYATHTIND